MARRSRLSGLLLLLLALAAAAGDQEEDHRAWQHGVNLLQVGEKLLLVWGSAGNPPRPNLGGDWPHDVYYAWVDGGKFEPQALVSQPEAQEPPSAALNSRFYSRELGDYSARVLAALRNQFGGHAVRTSGTK